MTLILGTIIVAVVAMLMLTFVTLLAHLKGEPVIGVFCSLGSLAYVLLAMVRCRNSDPALLAMTISLTLVLLSCGLSIFLALNTESSVRVNREDDAAMADRTRTRLL